MTTEEKELTITYLTEMQEEYIEGEGYERHPLPEYFALDMAIKTLEQQPSDDWAVQKRKIQAIPLDKVKQAREEIEQAYGDYDGYDPDALRDYSDRVYGILNKLIAESEEN